MGSLPRKHETVLIERDPSALCVAPTVDLTCPMEAPGPWPLASRAQAGIHESQLLG